MSHIIFLHGASSSGKTTLAVHLQNTIDQPFWHISIDHLRDSGVLPVERFNSGEFVWQSQREAVFDGFHHSLAAYANAGNNLILEHILDTNGWVETLKRQLAGHDVLFVGVQCPLDVLVEREKTRSNRQQGSAARDFHTIHVGRTYDLEIDTTKDIEANAASVIAAWRGGKRRSEFSIPELL